MLKGLYIDRDGNVALRETVLLPLPPDGVRVRAEFASIKHGTDFHNLFSHQSPFLTKRFDGRQELFVPLDDGESGVTFVEQFIGNTAVGVVTEVGPAVTRFQTGDRVYGYAPIQNFFTVPEKALHPLPDSLCPGDAVCLDPALYGYAAVRDARICLGDNAIVFGLGAIGLLVTQMLSRAGCLNIVAVDPLSKRRELARSYGATLALDPTGCDVAAETRRLLGWGADVAIEAGGSYQALREAMRAVRRCGRVVTLGFYKGHGTPLELGMEWMHNRLELISSMPTWGNPSREHPLWNEARLTDTVLALFQRKMLRSEGILDPIVPMDNAAEALLAIYRDPSDSVKLGVCF
ncbi:MAG: zinc-binding alcohol dehydrogenase [Akkermansiaceae bacterium]|nr:zinc-binding alcohol dehydrogenase [Armatimonadota bacterium]